MILLDRYCSLTYTTRFSRFFCFETYGKFRNVNGDIVICIFRYVIVMYSYFSAIWSALLHFCSFIYNAFLFIEVQSLFSRGRFLTEKGCDEKYFWGLCPQDPCFSSHPGTMAPENFLAGTATVGIWIYFGFIRTIFVLVT